MSELEECKKCHKFLINEEHRLNHPCKHWCLSGDETLEEAKKKFYNHYDELFMKKRQEIFQKIFPLYTYDAMAELANGLKVIPDIFKSKQEEVEEMKQISMEKFEKEKIAKAKKFENNNEKNDNGLDLE